MYKTIREQENEMVKIKLLAKLEDCEILMQRYQNSNPEKYERYKKEAESIKTRLHIIESDVISAAQKWCDVTNALIRKYKKLAEEHPQYANEQLAKLEECLIQNGFLCQQDIMDIL